MYKTIDQLTADKNLLLPQLKDAGKREKDLRAQLSEEKKGWANKRNMLECKVANFEAKVYQIGTHIADLAHAKKDLEDELDCAKAETDQQCDDFAKETLELACKIFQAEYIELDLRQLYDKLEIF